MTIDNKYIPLRHVQVDIQDVYGDSGRFSGVEMKFAPLNENEIYKKSSGEIVPFLPKDLGLSMDFRAVVDFNSLLLETLSSYLYGLRKGYSPNKDLLFDLPCGNSKYCAKIRVTNFFFREGKRGRYKIEVTFIEKESGEEIVTIPFTKKDVFLMHNLLVNKVSKVDRPGFSRVFGVIDSTGVDKDCTVSKVENSLLIDDVWLHGQEISILLYVVSQLRSSLGVEKRLSDIRSRYRQVECAEDGNIFYLKIRKMDAESQYITEEVKKIPFTARTMSVFSLLLDLDMLKRNKDESFEEEVDVFPEVHNIKHILPTKEAVFALSTKPSRKDPDKTDIVLSMSVRQEAFSIVNSVGIDVHGFIEKKNQDGGAVEYPVIKDFSFKIPPKYYKKIIKALSVGINKAYADRGRDFDSTKFYLKRSEPGGEYKYWFHFNASGSNKAPVVLHIVKESRGGDVVEVFKQPFFEKHAFQFLTQLVSLGRELNFFEDYEEINTIDTLRYRYKSMMKVVQVKQNTTGEFGIRRIGDSVMLGDLKNDDAVEFLDDVDRELLYISAKHKLFTGFFIPFTGSKIAIGQDGYITDLHGEININPSEEGDIYIDYKYAAIFAMGCIR